jgi:hypothetical protein
MAQRGGRGAGLHEFSDNENKAASQTPPPPRFAWSPSPTFVGADKQIHSRDACAPEFCQAIAKKPSLKRREVERRQAHLPLAASADAAARLALTRARSPLGAPPRLWSQRERCDPIQAALHASERMRALPAPSFALKRGTSRTGHNAGGDDARTARERGYKPRPQEPHSLHVQVCLENTPFDERDRLYITETGIGVKIWSL